MKTILFKIGLVSVGLVIFAGCGVPAIEQQDTVALVETIKLPKGLFVSTHDTPGISYYNLDGQFIAEIKIPYLTDPNNRISYIVFAGSIASGVSQIPVVYWTNNQEAALMVTKNGQSTVLLNEENVSGLASAPGEEVLAYATTDSLNNKFFHELFVGTLDSIQGSNAIISQPADCFCTLTPLLVKTDNDTIQGVWYTISPTGLGGMGFYPNKGLYYYDIARAEIKQILDSQQNFHSLAQDQSMAAIMDDSDRVNRKLKIIDLNTNASQIIPLDPSSTNGGGGEKFSPDNHLIAWEEASGTTMSDTPDFHSRLRVARLGDSPEVIYDLTDAAIGESLGFSNVLYVTPIGWLDQQTLLIQASGQDNFSVIAKLDIPSGTLSSLIKGSFIGFAYE